MSQKSPRRVAAIIPARMDSSRFPGKPLFPILGLPMIEHVRRRTERIEFLDSVYVATCDEEIRKVVESYGGKVIMTRADHQRATERIEEAAHQIDAEIIVNVQGDEPLVSEEVLTKLVSPLLNRTDVGCSCICYPIHDLSELENRNIVKVVLSQSGRILYLSRNSIPGFHSKANQPKQFFKQSGFMAFTKEFLHQFVKLPSTPLEKVESVDMLRLLENDLWLQGVVTDLETKGVDVPGQVDEIEHAILSSPQEKRLFQIISSQS